VAVTVADGCGVKVGRKGVIVGPPATAWVGVEGVGATSSRASKKLPSNIPTLTTVTRSALRS
jgi:hypothetical protein